MGGITIPEKFNYKVRDKSGELIEGTLEAESKQTVVKNLKNKGYYITKIEKEIGSRDLLTFLNKFRRVKLGELSLFCRQFSVMISAGISLVRTLNILAEQMDNPKFSAVITSVRDDVESGLVLSTALGKHKIVFPKLFINMVEAGETGGILDEVLQDMADHFERENEIKQKVISALAYPVLISLLALAIIFFFITFILPTFTDLFASLDLQLPLLTRILLFSSQLLATYWYLFLAGVVGLIVTINKYYKTDNGKRNIDLLLLKVPLVNDLIIKLAVNKFSRTLGVLLGSGVSILEGMKVVSGVVSNQILVDKIRQARQSVSEGDNMATPLEEGKLFPPMLIQMIRIGEETGNLDEMLTKVSQLYSKEVEQQIDTLVSLIEPLMILIIGLIVGTIVAAMVLPMFNMTNAF